MSVAKASAVKRHQARCLFMEPFADEATDRLPGGQSCHWGKSALRGDHPTRALNRALSRSLCHLAG
jgi:hypothetical protein